MFLEKVSFEMALAEIPGTADGRREQSVPKRSIANLSRQCLCENNMIESTVVGNEATSSLKTQERSRV
ncbi:unnamed protein product [Parnassius apollo]|uniref:(apollo) hypothetical protein n=1 Tax=Parnassius apollo TaxID=110799 RepID=A0A8S3WG92_PARAO|nr:unnamed protein product [Parnassius apollo]